MTTTPTPQPPGPRGQPERHDRLRHPAEGETTLYLVRHGRTASNVGRLLHGSTDVPLDALGLRQAHLIAERLAGETKPDTLLSSPLDRALTTARIIGGRIGLEPVIVPGLVEIDFGAVEGFTLERVAEEHPDLALRLLDTDGDDVAWPGGESRRQFHERVFATVQSILNDYAAHTIVVVAHGGVIGSLVAQITGGDPNDARLFSLVNCSLTHIHVTPSHTLLHCVNDAGHLEILGDPDDPLEVAP